MRVAVIIPAHDEAAILEANAKKVWQWGSAAFPDFILVLSENGSHDSTAWVAKLLEKIQPGVIALNSNMPGKGGAIKRAAASVEADVYLFMDADLSADLSSVETIVRDAMAGSDLVIGSRRAQGADVDRPFVRKACTAAYASVVQSLLGLDVRDPQCGCKAFSRRFRDEILPRVRDDGFFFDTELLARAKRHGFKITETGIRWTERPGEAGKSKVKLFSTGLAFLEKAAALRKDLR